MTSPRFQSQSLNWLNRQRLRWNDRLQQSWRSVQVAVSWGAQVLLYPFYIAVQSSRLLLQQWQTRQAPAMGLTGDMASEPVSESVDQGTLTVVVQPSREVAEPPPDFVDLFFNTLSGTFAFKPRSTHPAGLVPLAEPPQLQGIASLRLGSATYPQRSLVWVDDRNQLWSIPLAHQQAFQYKILTIVANHTPLPSNTSLKLLPEHPQQLPPLRWMHRLINWMQTSPLAQATNLFQESQIHPLALPAAPFPNPVPPQVQQRLQKFSLVQGDAMLRFLDYHLALIEPQGSGVSSPSSVPRDPVSPSPPSPLTDSPATLKLESPLLLQPSLSYPELFQPELQEASDLRDVEDFCCRRNLSAEVMPEDYRQLPPIASPPVLSPLPTTLPQPVPVEVSPALAPTQPPSPVSITIERQQTPALPPSGREEESLEQEIEVKSEAIGYEKHPLENLLHWIDRIVTWLERQVTKLLG
ncbi:MAG: hypothetical protein ACO37W_15680 [Prochlorotrichaceae cyanobacterium]